MRRLKSWKNVPGRLGVKNEMRCPIPARMIIAMLAALLVPLSSCVQDTDLELIEAARNGQTEEVQALLEAGADVNAISDADGMALILAAARGHTEIVRMLLEAGADVNAKTSNGNTALLRAAARGHAGIVELLRKAGAKK